jgi:hypothetical protein
MGDPRVIVWLLFAALGGAAIGLAIGHRFWGPRWFDTSEGIDRKFRKMKRF